MKVICGYKIAVITLCSSVVKFLHGLMYLAAIGRSFKANGIQMASFIMSPVMYGTTPAINAAVKVIEFRCIMYKTPQSSIREKPRKEARVNRIKNDNLNSLSLIFGIPQISPAVRLPIKYPIIYPPNGVINAPGPGITNTGAPSKPAAIIINTEIPP